MGQWRFEAIGTGWEIETGTPLADDARAAVTAEIEQFDRVWSRFRDDSDVARLGRSGGSLSSPDAGPMLDAYRELDAATAGAPTAWSLSDTTPCIRCGPGIPAPLPPPGPRG